jgi:hypothetical protein
VGTYWCDRKSQRDTRVRRSGKRTSRGGGSVCNRPGELGSERGVGGRVIGGETNGVESIPARGSEAVEATVVMAPFLLHHDPHPLLDDKILISEA